MTTATPSIKTTAPAPRQVKPLIWRILAEPMLHFVIVGAIVFAAYGAVAPPAAPPANVIAITPAQITQLEAGYQSVWNRPPTEAERTHLIDNYIKEEVFVREALLLGLDRDDYVIRQRLRQKMEYLLTTGTGALTPSEDDIRTHYDAIKGTLAAPAMLGFAQIFLGDADAAGAEQALAALAAGADPATLGQSSLLPEMITDGSRTQVDGNFGAGFFDAISGSAPCVWTGPHTSAFGQHLVYVTKVTPGLTPPLDRVRDLVIDDWRRVQAENQSAETYAFLRSRYQISLPDGAAEPAPGTATAP